MYEDIIRYAPKAAQERIRIFAETVEQIDSPARLQQYYHVGDLRELISHLVEYECGTAYIAEDPLISSYRGFWSTLDKAYGKDRYSEIHRKLDSPSQLDQKVWSSMESDLLNQRRRQKGG